MLAMTHHVDDDSRLLVYAMASGCKCEWTAHINSEDRMGKFDETARIRTAPKRKPKQWYREAENILLSGEKVVLRDGILECKQHKGK